MLAARIASAVIARLSAGASSSPACSSSLPASTAGSALHCVTAKAPAATNNTAPAPPNIRLVGLIIERLRKLDSLAVRGLAARQAASEAMGKGHKRSLRRIQ